MRSPTCERSVPELRLIVPHVRQPARYSSQAPPAQDPVNRARSRIVGEPSLTNARQAPGRASSAGNAGHEQRVSSAPHDHLNRRCESDGTRLASTPDSPQAPQAQTALRVDWQFARAFPGRHPGTHRHTANPSPPPGMTPIRLPGPGSTAFTTSGCEDIVSPVLRQSVRHRSCRWILSALQPRAGWRSLRNIAGLWLPGLLAAVPAACPDTVPSTPPALSEVTTNGTRVQFCALSSPKREVTALERPPGGQ